MVAVKELLAHPENYGGTRKGAQIRYLVFHYTGNDGDSAAGNAAYFQNNTVKTSAHYFVDDTDIWRSVPDLRIAWAVGGSKYPNAEKTGGGTLYGTVTNTNSISIELCDTVKNGVYQASEATLANAVALGRELMATYRIPLERVVRHFDVTGKHCPSYLIGAEKWAAFRRRLTADDVPSPAHREGVVWAVQNGSLLGDDTGDLKLHQPVTREQLCTMLYRYSRI